MNNFFSLISGNVAVIYLVIYLLLLLFGGVFFAIYEMRKKKRKKESEKETCFVYVSPAEHRHILKDIKKAENFGNEPLSKYKYHSALQNGVNSRKQKNIRLVNSLLKEDGNTL